jgi:tetratricopeptide (TPR) repeat protein
VIGPAATPWTALERAGQMLERGALDDAESAYREALGASPGNLQAILGLGLCSQARGDWAAALHWFETAAAHHPASPWPALRGGDTLRMLGRTQEAEESYLRALNAADAAPARAQASIGLGHCAQARGDHGAAMARFQAASAADPNDPWAHLYSGDELCALARFEDAEAAYRLASTHPVTRVRALLGLGRCAQLAGDDTGALERFEAAASADPSETQAWTSLAQAHHAAGRWQAALDALRRLAETHPDLPDVWVDMALNERRLGRPTAAAQCLERALACAPEHCRALETLGELARLTRDYDQALALFGRAVAAHPANIWPRIGLAHTLAEIGRFGEALEALDAAEERATTADASQPAIAAKRLEVLRRAGRWRQALELAREAVKAWPRSFGLWSQHFLIELLAGDADSIDACLVIAPAETPQEQARVLQFQGQAAEAQWRLDDAVAHYAQALELNPNDAWEHQNMARVRLLRLDLAEARTHIETMLSLETDFATLIGRPARVAWTHYGEMLNEFALDKQALAALRALRDRPAGERIDPLLGVVRDFPDSTAAAIALLIALRQAGHLARAPAQGRRPSPIPRTIAQYWHGASPPPDVRALIRTWQEWHPDHAVTLFNDPAARAFLARVYGPDVTLAYRRAREPAQKADMFRLAWLFAHGGYYVDCDDRCHGPLDSVTPPDVTLALYQEDLGAVGNNWIAAAPQHPLIGRALNLAVEAVNAGGDDGVWFNTGPGLLTRALAQTLATSRLAWPGWLENIAVLHRSALNPAVAMHCSLGYKVTSRHWSQPVVQPQRRQEQ